MEDKPKAVEVELRYIRRDLDEIKAKLDGAYVTKAEFQPVKNLVYGLVALILTSFIGALITLILRV